jgi:glucose/mannose-6-phosphate isomerase
MINQKYYSDIKNFPKQFVEGLELAKDLKVNKEFNRVVVCGMGGSSLYTEIINDFLAREKEFKIKLEANRGYDLPLNCDENTLIIVASHSGNTEETLSCLEAVKERELQHCIFCSGGKLLEKSGSAPTHMIPGGIQPRLSTGYFITGILKLLENCGKIKGKCDHLLEISKVMDQCLDEEKAKLVAKSLVGNVPIVYSSSVNSSLARVAKIKFNENAKTQSFWNYFPEQNHNEMVGFTNLVMQPNFLIFQSKFCNPQNKKRGEIFAELMQKKNVPVNILPMVGESIMAEIINAYYFVDHVTYYLAQEYGIDPEPVDMVEEFKELIKEEDFKK